jgi:hypothetical protein
MIAMLVRKALVALASLVVVLSVVGIASAATSQNAYAAVTDGTTITTPKCQGLVTKAQERNLVAAKPTAKLVETRFVTVAKTSVTCESDWHVQANWLRFGAVRLVKGPGALKQYRLMQAAVRAGTYHALKSGPAGSGYFYHTGISAFMYVNRTLVVLTGVSTLKPAALVTPMWRLFNELSQSACTYLDRAHVDALLGVSAGTPVSGKPSRFDGAGNHYRECAWSLGSKQAFLRLTAGPKAHTQFATDSRYDPALPGGPAGSKWADYDLNGITAVWFAHSTFIQVSGPVGINASGTALTRPGAMTLSAALTQVGQRLA